MNQRLQRLADQIQRELAVLIRDEVNDPRLTGFVQLISAPRPPKHSFPNTSILIHSAQMTPKV